MIFDENIDLYDEVIEINSAHLAVKGRKGNVVFFDGMFELERNTPISVLIQLRTSMNMMGATVAFIDINTDGELQECIADMFFMSTTTTTTTTTSTTTTKTTKPTDTDNDNSDEDKTDANNDEDTEEPDIDVDEGICPGKVDFSAHTVELSIDDGEAIFNIEIKDGSFTPDEWGVIVLFDDNVASMNVNDNMVVIDQGQKYALLQGVGCRIQLSLTTDLPTGAMVGYIDGFIDNQVLSCIKEMTGVEAAKNKPTEVITTTIKHKVNS
jgi:hypothetical protein